VSFLAVFALRRISDLDSFADFLYHVSSSPSINVPTFYLTDICRSQMLPGLLISVLPSNLSLFILAEILAWKQSSMLTRDHFLPTFHVTCMRPYLCLNEDASLRGMRQANGASTIVKPRVS
jgi:hypothetical protein